MKEDMRAPPQEGEPPAAGASAKDVLRRFCGIDSSRASILTPCEVGGYAYATDGHIAGRMPVKVGEVGSTPEALKLFERVPDLFQKAKDSVERWISIVNLPNIPKCKSCNGETNPPKEERCEECDGDDDVELENDFNTYHIECKSCDGDGEVLGDGVCKACYGRGIEGGNRPIGCDLHGVRLNLELLRSIQDLPGLRIGLHKPSELLAHYFTWDGGDGVIMPLRISTDSDTRVLPMEWADLAEGPLKAESNPLPEEIPTP